MNRLKILVAAFTVAVVTLGIYSCAKEVSGYEVKKNEVENRTLVITSAEDSIQAKCPWCVVKDITGGISGGFAGSFAGPIGSMIGAVAWGFADSYHEYTHSRVIGGANGDVINYMLESIPSIEDRQNNQYNYIGKLHNQMLKKAIKKVYVHQQPFQNETDFLNFVRTEILIDPNFENLVLSQELTSLIDSYFSYRSNGKEIPLSYKNKLARNVNSS